MIISKRKEVLDLKVTKSRRENKSRLSDEYAKWDLTKAYLPEFKKVQTRYLKIPAKFISIFKRQKPNDYTVQEKKLLEHRNCFCGKVDNQKMIQCEQCDKWLHFHCVGIGSQNHANSIPNFICPNCQGTKKMAHKDSNGSQKRLRSKTRKNSYAATPTVTQSEEDFEYEYTNLLNELILNSDDLKLQTELQITQLKNKEGNKVGYIRDSENRKKKIWILQKHIDEGVMSTKIGKLSIYFEDSKLQVQKISDDQYLTVKRKLAKEGIMKKVQEKPCGLQVNILKENQKLELKPKSSLFKTIICDQYVANVDCQFCVEFLKNFPVQARSDNVINDMKRLFLGLQENFYNELKQRAV